MNWLTGIIAEIGLNHFGSLAKAKEMIRAAHDSGATYIKLAAIDPKEMSHGSMPIEFYRQVALTFEEYVELRIYGEEIGANVFFSIFGERFQDLPRMFPGMILKVAGKQFKEWDAAKLGESNTRNTIVSIPNLPFHDLAPKTHAISRMNKLFVTQYLPKDNEVSFDPIAIYLDFFRSPIGYSDHSVGIGNCQRAIAEYGCQLLEKHFFLGKEIKWEGQVFRDSLHSATPKELEKLVKFYQTEFDDE